VADYGEKAFRPGNGHRHKGEVPGIKKILFISGVLGLLFIALLYGSFSEATVAAFAQASGLQPVTIAGNDKVMEVSGSQILISGVKNQVTVTNDDVKQITVSGVDNTILYRKEANPRIIDSGVNTKIRQY